MAPSTVSPEMRKRLLVNRHGKMTSDQWKDMVTEPLVTLLLLFVPVLFVLGPRVVMMGRMLWIGGFAVAILLFVPVIFRAYRYARMPLHFAELKAGDESPAAWKVWKAPILYTKAGQMVRFNKRLAPYSLLRRDKQYLVYYLKDSRNNILLSIAPADHPDAKSWQPSTAFEARFHQRGGK